MTITRVFQAHGEYGAWEPEFTAKDGYGAAAISAVQKKTGSYSFVTGGPGWFEKNLPTDYDRFRFGFHFRHEDGPKRVNGQVPEIFHMEDTGPTGTWAISLHWDYQTDQLRLQVDGKTPVYVDGSDTFSINTWYHIGIDAKIAADGFVYCYVDGTEILNYDEDITATITNVDFVQIGTWTNAHQWRAAGQYFDNIYFDDMTGETDTPAAPPQLEFDIVRPTGVGTTTAWTPTATNWADVDEAGAHDSDTTKIDATATDTKDTYAMADYSLPSNYSIAAVHPFAFAKDDDDGTDVKVALVTRVLGTEEIDAGTATGAAYALVTERRATDPNSATWTNTTVDAMEVGVQSEGTFA